MDFKELLKQEFVMLDGAMGTMLQKSGVEIGSIPEELNITNPQLITDIHKQYIDAGSNIIYANTFGANIYKLSKSKYTVEEIISAAITNAKNACKGTDTLVALDIGPIGQLLEPTGTMSFDEAYDIYAQEIKAAKDADVIVFETMTDLYELKAGVLAAKENCDKPILCTMTFEENARTFTGCSPESMALTIEGLGVAAIGMNCSLGPDQVAPVVEQISKWTTLPLIVKPNAGLPDPVTGEYSINPKMFSNEMLKLIHYGVKIFGGCCGTSPDYIKEMKNSLADKKFFVCEKNIPAAVCSPTKTVVIDKPCIIGERINPTGKKLFKQALLNNDIDYILNQAIEQVRAGADILDVNVGMPDIDEKAMMLRVVKAVQGISDAPLQIDSTQPDVLETALKYYNGKPIVNSVNGEQKSLDTILPLVKKYGTSVIGLTLDENGIPKTCEQRFKIAEKIMHTAMSYGIKKQDIYIDCLTLTASAEQAGVQETLKAVKMIKEKLGLKTVLGVSNISFGLPSREIINRNFLTMALTNGLDLPIINPNVDSMTSAVRAYKLLMNIDKNSVDFIANYGNEVKKETPAKLEQNVTLEFAIDNGLKNEAGKIVTELLVTMTPMQIINSILIPALDKAGEQFEKGIIFLPQLISSATVAQVAFEVIKNEIAKSNKEAVSKGKIVIATVKGDVHDIGKNIVKVLLENYGYQVIDLGKDVDEKIVVEAMIKNDCKLLGLSALMTTTLKSMESTIRLVRENNIDCKIMVGGAVLTSDYALKIGADYYAKDAKESVDIAKKVLG